MKLIITNQHSIELELQCKQCTKTYTINYDDVSTMPLWKFENCSRNCALEFSKDKFLTIKSTKKKPLYLNK
jgi:hypothetical protein